MMTTRSWATTGWWLGMRLGLAAGSVVSTMAADVGGAPPRPGVPPGFAVQGARVAPEIYAGLAQLGRDRGCALRHLDEWPLLDNWDLESWPTLAKEEWRITPNAMEKQSGLVLFARPWADFVFPWSLPDNRIETVRAFAAPGEYEPLTFAVHALAELPMLQVRLSPLRDAAGHELAVANLDLREVRMIPWPEPRKQVSLDYPSVLEHSVPADLKKGTTRQYWLTAYVPTGTPAGLYRGRAELLAAGASAGRQLAVELEVLPITLQEPDRLFGNCFLLNGDNNMYPENLDKYFTDMREHGLNSMWTWPLANITKVEGKIKIDFATRPADPSWGGTPRYFHHSLSEILDGYKKAGFTKPWVYGSFDGLQTIMKQKFSIQPYTPEFDAIALDLARQVRTMAAAKGLPDPYFSVVDEPGFYPEQMIFADYYQKLLRKQIPDIKLFLDCGPWVGEDRKFAKELNVLCYNSYGAERAKLCREFGIEQWAYNQGGGGRVAYTDRYYWGLSAQKSELRGVFQWVYTWFFNFAGQDGNRYVYPAADGPVPTMSWEGVREGIDDARYYTTLQRLAEQAEAGGNRAGAQAARAVLAAVLADIPVERAARERYLHTHPSTTFDQHRRALADAILKLQGSPPPVAPPAPPKAVWQAPATASFANGETASLRSEKISGVLNLANFAYQVEIKVDNVLPEGAYFGGQGENWFVRLAADRAVEFGVFNNGQVILASRPWFLAPGAWYQVRAEYDGAAMQLFLNGKLVGRRELAITARQVKDDLRLSGFPWEAPDAKGYGDRRAPFLGAMRQAVLLSPL